MPRVLIKNSFMGFTHRVAPLQNVFKKECGDAVLNTDVLEFLSGLQKELVGNMVNGACAISRYRRREEVNAKDMLCHLDKKWKIDPLLLSSIWMRTCYQVTKRTDKINPSLTVEPVTKKRRTRSSSNLPKRQPASSKAKKNSKKSELKSKRDQSNKVVKRKSKVNLKSQVTCLKDPFKNLPLSNKNPELKAKKQPSIKASAPNKLEFLGNKCKFGVSNVDGILKPSARVPVYKLKPKEEEKKLICQNSINIPPVEEKEVKCDVPVWVSLDPETNTFKIVGWRTESVADAVPTLPVVSTSKLKSKVHEQSSNCEYSVKTIPFKEKTESEIKVPSKIHIDPETHKLRITEIKDFSKQSPETCINIPRSNVDEKMSAYKHSTGVFPFKEKIKPEVKVLTKICSDEVTPKFRIISGIKDFSKKSPQTSINNPKSNVGEKISISKHSTEVFKEKTEPEYKILKNIDFDGVTQKFKIPVIKDLSQRSPQASINNPRLNVGDEMLTCRQQESTGVFSLKEKTGPEFKRAKHASIEIPCPNSQVFKIAGKKGKQGISSVKYASDETLEEARHHSVEIPHPYSCVRKISLKRGKQEVFDMDDVKVETREEARRKLAIILLRIAGKYH